VVTYFNIAEIIISIVLILVLLLQARGAGFSGTFNSDSSVFRTRRGVEKTLFQLTIFLAALFVVISILSVVAAKSAPV
jgi:preprotein translocase subunit SecG